MRFTDNYNLDLDQSFGSGFDMQDYSLQSNTPADGCTLCGMCLSSCPTYQLNSDIRQSPIGRIQIIRGINDIDYHYSEEDYTALDSCLVCRACESRCPSNVAYANMLDSAKQTLKQYRQQSLAVRVLMKLVERPLLLSVLVSMTKPVQPLVSAIVRAFQNVEYKSRKNTSLESESREHKSRENKSGANKGRVNIKTWENLLSGLSYLKYSNNPIVKPIEKNEDLSFQSQITSPTLPFKKVSLFTGCMASIFDKPVLEATIKLLNSCNVEVLIPKTQSCCGAIHAHNGEPAKAAELAIKNLSALVPDSVDAIISTASGCGQALQNYDRLLDDNAYCVSSRAKRFSEKVTDISTFLIESDVLSSIQLSDSDQIVAIHVPCSMTNTNSSAITTTLMQKIPCITLHQLPENIGCCGAGGSHLITHSEAAGKIRNKTLEALVVLNPDIVVTSNVGCALHLKEGIAKNAMEIEILHPVQLLERQMSTKERI